MRSSNNFQKNFCELRSEALRQIVIGWKNLSESEKRYLYLRFTWLASFEQLKQVPSRQFCFAEPLIIGERRKIQVIGMDDDRRERVEE